MIGYLDISEWMMKILRIGIFVPLVIFLFLQLFLFVSKPASKRDDSNDSEP